MMNRVEALDSSELEHGVITCDPTVERPSWEMDEIQQRSGSATWKSVLIQGSVLLVYLICGGLVFWVLEGGKKSQQQMSEQVESVITATSLLSNVTRYIESNCSSSAELTKILRLLESIISNDKLRGNSSLQISSAISSVDDNSIHVWNIPGSIFFAVTIVTTIGYGNVVPVTAMGRVFCCLYALLGIPLCLVFLVNIGEKLNSSSGLLDRRLNGLLRPRLARPLRAVLIVAIGTVVFMIVPSFVFSRLQDWKFGTALYFSFISLSTIGFGDYVAGINYFGPHRPLYRILVAIWIFLGLSWLAGIVSSIQETYQNLAKEFEAKSFCRLSKENKMKPLLKIEENPVDDRSATPCIYCRTTTAHEEGRSAAPYADRTTVSSRTGQTD